jgi:SAM-dependent methyltransferase
MNEKLQHVEIEGYCPICEKAALFVANGSWYRGTLLCQTCKNGSTPRERALAHVLHREIPHWREVAIHECSPMNRGISIKIRSEAKRYVGSHYFPDRSFGTIVDGWRNENIEATTFDDECFELVISLDVAEHVFNPAAKFRDIWRTLKFGGLYVSTFPIRKGQVEAAVPLARLLPDGAVEFLKTPPEYHGNPINSKGALVTWDYGYDIHKLIADWAPFSVEISRFSDRHQGIIGEYTEVIVCRKS